VSELFLLTEVSPPWRGFIENRALSTHEAAASSLSSPLFQNSFPLSHFLMQELPFLSRLLPYPIAGNF